MNPPFINYMVQAHSSLEMLERAVTKSLLDGWVPVGNLVIDGKYYQPLALPGPQA